MLSTIRGFVRKHQTASFFGLAFGLAWVAMAPSVLETYGLVRLGIPMMITTAVGAMCPCLAAVLISYLLKGRAGIKELYAPVLRWRVHPGWYGAAILLRPAIMLAAIGVVYLWGPGLPQPKSVDPFELVFFTLGWIFVVGLVGEEMGWMGFALPRLQKRCSGLVAGLLLGVLWGLWHLPFFFIAGTDQFGASIPLFVLKLTAFRVLFVWIYNGSGSSLLMPILAHVAYNAALLIIPQDPNALLL